MNLQEFLRLMAIQSLAEWYDDFNIEEIGKFKSRDKRIVLSAKCYGLVWHDRWLHRTSSDNRGVFPV